MLRFSDFKSELFPKIRNLIRSRDYNHPWLQLDDDQLLKKAGLYRRDQQTGQEGYTLAATLLLGQDEVIQSILPQYKTDALVRRRNTDRYDDRLYIQTNLIDAYEQLMDFIAKHLPDKFFLEGTVCVSLRSKIFREIVANLLVHREFMSGFSARLIIYADRVITENANRPHHYGRLVPENFSPYAKNPVIAKFFTQLGHVDELGSGILNVNKYLPHYSPGKSPVFEEGDVFKMVIPLDAAVGMGINEGKSISEGIHDAVNDAVNDAVKERLKSELQAIFSSKGLFLKQIITQFNVQRATAQRDMKLLKDAGLIEFHGAAKNGKYVLKPQFEEILFKNR